MEFRRMRRYRQELGEEEAAEILKNSTSGVMACLAPGGWPYAVPLSYVYVEAPGLTDGTDKAPYGCIYFHMAKEGQKADAIASEPRVSFCVIGQDVIVPEEVTTYFKSVIAFGTARILPEPLKMEAAQALGNKYASECPEAVLKDIRDNYNSMHMVEIRIEHLTGKQARELMENR